MACKLKIKNPVLKELLGAEEFDTFREMQRNIPVGKDILVKDSQGHFLAKLRKIAFSGKSLNVYYDSPEYGRGQTEFSDVIGVASQENLVKFASELNPLAKSKLLNLPIERKPIGSDGGTIVMESLDYDPEESAIKIEQFESTTGQDVESESNGTLNPKDSTLAKMELREMVAKTPGRFRAFIVKDSDAYQNEEGVEPTGEVLLVVHAFAYESLRAEKGRDLTQEELNEVAVKTQGKIHTLPLERSGEGSGSFFQRNHDERVASYATKYNVSIAEAEKHFRDGESRMADARKRAESSPVPVRIKSVSKGSLTKDPMRMKDLMKKFKLSFSKFRLGTSRDDISGRIYIELTQGDQNFSVLTVPESISNKYGAQFVWDTYQASVAAGAAGAGSSDSIERGFIVSLFGTNRRPKGPYLKGDALMFNGEPITSFEVFIQALNENDWPILRNKVDSSETYTGFLDGQFVEMTGDEFIESHVNTDGGLWTHKGKVVPYKANRYFYLDIGEFKPVSRVSTTKDQVVRTAEDLFRDPNEYDRILQSSDPEDIAFKKSQPHLFSIAFLKSQSFGRLRKRLKFNPPVSGNLAIPYPVGGKYFGSKGVVTRKINEILLNYYEAGVKFPFSTEGDLFSNFDNYIRSKVEKAIKDGVELNTSESEFNALYTHFSNEFVAHMETSILIPFSNKPITIKRIAPTQAIQVNQVTKPGQQTRTTNPALSSVEATTEALEGVDATFTADLSDSQLSVDERKQNARTLLEGNGITNDGSYSLISMALEKVDGVSVNNIFDLAKRIAKLDNKPILVEYIAEAIQYEVGRVKGEKDTFSLSIEDAKDVLLHWSKDAEPANKTRMAEIGIVGKTYIDRINKLKVAKKQYETLNKQGKAIVETFLNRFNDTILEDAGLNTDEYLQLLLDLTKDKELVDVTENIQNAVRVIEDKVAIELQKLPPVKEPLKNQENTEEALKRFSSQQLSGIQIYNRNTIVKMIDAQLKKTKQVLLNTALPEVYDLPSNTSSIRLNEKGEVELLDKNEKKISGKKLIKEQFVDIALQIGNNQTTKNAYSISGAYHKAKADGSNPELVKAVEELLGGQQVVPPTVELKEGFTEGPALNKLFNDVKEKYGAKKGDAIYQAATRLVNPNNNTLVEIRSNGVIVFEGGKYIMKAFTNTDANPKKWELTSFTVDVTDQLSWREAYKKADPFKKSLILRRMAEIGSENQLSDVLDMLVKGAPDESKIAWEIANRTKSRETFERAVSNRALRKFTTDENIDSLRREKFGREAEEIEISIESGNFAEPTFTYWSNQLNPDSVASNFGNDRNPSPSISVLTRPKGEGYAMTWDAYRDFAQANGTWTSEDEAAYNKALTDGDEFSLPERTVQMVYNGPVKSEIDQNGVVSRVKNGTFVADVTIVSPNSRLGRQMYHEGFDMAGPIDADAISLAYLSTPTNTTANQTEAERHEEFLKSLETVSVTSVPVSEEYEYAVNILGKNFAQRLFSTGQPVTFADVDRFKNDLGKPYSFTKSMTQKEFALSKDSADKIKSGNKTLTLRNPDARYHSKSGLVEIEGEFFDFQEIGNINLDEALKRTGMTQQEFTKAFMGEDVGIENIFDPGVKQFFNNEVSRRVYQIRKLGKANKVKAKSVKSKQRVLPC